MFKLSRLFLFLPWSASVYVLSASSCCSIQHVLNESIFFFRYTCSPQNPLLYPCCTPEDGSASQCQIVSASANRVCNDETSCAAASKCNGVSAACPLGTPKQSWVTECGCINDDCATYPHTGDRVCMRGACNVSRCRIFGAWPCEAPHAPCALSCKGSGWGNGSECVSTFNTTARHVNQTWGVHYSAGQVCDGMKGYVYIPFFPALCHSFHLLRDDLSCTRTSSRARVHLTWCLNSRVYRHLPCSRRLGVTRSCTQVLHIQRDLPTRWRRHGAIFFQRDPQLHPGVLVGDTSHHRSVCWTASRGDASSSHEATSRIRVARRRGKRAVARSRQRQARWVRNGASC